MRNKLKKRASLLLGLFMMAAIICVSNWFFLSSDLALSYCAGLATFPIATAAGRFIGEGMATDEPTT